MAQPAIGRARAVPVAVAGAVTGLFAVWAIIAMFLLVEGAAFVHSRWAVLLAIITIMVFMSELTSNTAQVATMLPILAALAPVLGVPASTLLVPATIAASCAFMMPVGTPPNASVFGTGLVRMPQMVRAGLWLNLAGIVVIFVLTYAVIVPTLGAGR